MAVCAKLVSCLGMLGNLVDIFLDHFYLHASANVHNKIGNNKKKLGRNTHNLLNFLSTKFNMFAFFMLSTMNMGLVVKK